MFEKQNEWKRRYEDNLRKINSIGTNIKTDEDKIMLLNLINNLKYFCGCIEPQESYDMYNK